MGFEEIALSLIEMRRLKKSATKGVPVKKCEMLLALNFVTEERRHIPGYAGTPIGIAKITETGKLYLAYAKRRTHEHRVTRVISVVALIVSILSLLLQLMTELSK